MKPTNVVELPVFIDVHDVMRTMKCSRTMAYGHMRAALGRKPGERGQVRVPVYVWQRYVHDRFDSTSADESRQRGNSTPSRNISPVPLTRPRTKPRPPPRSPDER